MLISMHVYTYNAFRKSLQVVVFMNMEAADALDHSQYFCMSHRFMNFNKSSSPTTWLVVLYITSASPLVFQYSTSLLSVH